MRPALFGVINDNSYVVAVHGKNHFAVSKEGGETYDCLVTERGLICDCGDFCFRNADMAWGNSSDPDARCKHLILLQDLGFC